MKKNGYPYDTARWSRDPDKTVMYELKFKDDIMVQGTKFKLKYDSKIYNFICFVYCKKIIDGVEKIITWVECMSNEGYKSVRPEQIYKLVKPKRSYRKNVNRA